MGNSKQLLVPLTLVLLALLLRDSPYLNTIFINRIWFFYFASLLFVFLIVVKFRVVLLWYMTLGLFIIAFILTLMRLDFFAELIGVLIYFSLWAIVFHRLIGFVKDKQ